MNVPDTGLAARSGPRIPDENFAASRCHLYTSSVAHTAPGFTPVKVDDLNATQGHRTPPITLATFRNPVNRQLPQFLA